MFFRTLVPHLLGVLDFWIKPLFSAPTPPLSIHQPVVQQNESGLGNYTVFSRLEQDNVSKRPVSGTCRSLKHSESKTKVPTYSGPVFRIPVDLWHPTRSCGSHIWVHIRERDNKTLLKFAVSTRGCDHHIACLPWKPSWWGPDSITLLCVCFGFFFFFLYFLQS